MGRAAPRDAAIGRRVAVVLSAAATGDVDPADNAVSVSPKVVGVGDSNVGRSGRRGFAGTATKGRGKGVKAKRLRPEAVHVAVLRKGGKRCSWLASARGGFVERTRAKGGGCTKQRWIRARGVGHWRLDLGRALPKGRYVVVSRTTIGAGFAEARFSAQDRNKVEFGVG